MPPPSQRLRTLKQRIFGGVLAGFVVLVAACGGGSAHAGELPPLPLPDCFTNGLAPDASTDCEGTLASYSPSVPDVDLRPAQGEVKLKISTREVDFRSDADLPGDGQLVTFTFSFPPDAQASGPEGVTYRSVVMVHDWPKELEPFTGATVSCRQATEAFWGTGCDAGSVGIGVNPKPVLLVRQGACEQANLACTYRLTWGPYDKRVREPMAFRIRFGWDVFYTKQLSSGLFVCDGVSTPSGCPLGGGASFVTFASTPPPPLKAIGTQHRLDAKAFEFDARESSPKADVRSYKWSLLLPDNRFVSATDPVFRFDFAKETGIPDTFFQGSKVATLQVEDRWGRTAFGYVPFSFLEPAGTEGPLEITALELSEYTFNVDERLATLKTLVKNKSGTAITDISLVSKGLGLISSNSTPTGISIEAGATVEFTVTIKAKADGEFTLEMQAFGIGTSNTGPVKSLPKLMRFDPVPTLNPTSSGGEIPTQIPAPSSGGGGGSTDPLFLLAGLWIVQRRRANPESKSPLGRE